MACQWWSWWCGTALGWSPPQRCSLCYSRSHSGSVWGRLWTWSYRAQCIGLLCYPHNSCNLHHLLENCWTSLSGVQKPPGAQILKHLQDVKKQNSISNDTTRMDLGQLIWFLTVVGCGIMIAARARAARRFILLFYRWRRLNWPSNSEQLQKQERLY